MAHSNNSLVVGKIQGTFGKELVFLANNILGTWALADMENASFVIEKKKILIRKHLLHTNIL